ncbi:uncharacterized protein METZ01_LOCUS385706, partial [marine metagenome]
MVAFGHFTFNSFANNILQEKMMKLKRNIES